MCLYLEYAQHIFAVISNTQTFSVMEKKTEQRKHFLHCNIAGFTYWDGCMDKRFKAKMFHRRGKALAKIIRAQMHPDDVLFYYRSMDDDSGVVMKRSRVRQTDTPLEQKDDLQLTLPLHQIPV